MNRRDDNTEPRRPHTFYLTDAVWDQLERNYLEQRLAGGTLSKIAFVEGVLEAGLGAHGRETAPPSGRRDLDATDGTTEGSSEGPRVLPPAPAAAPAPSQRPPSQRPPSQRPTSLGSPDRDPTRPRSPKSTALARLREASDPGRPPPISSAARPSNGEGVPTA